MELSFIGGVPILGDSLIVEQSNVVDLFVVGRVYPHQLLPLPPFRLFLLLWGFNVHDIPAVG